MPDLTKIFAVPRNAKFQPAQLNELRKYRLSTANATHEPVEMGPSKYWYGRVRLLGFQCKQESVDHILEVDGARDEVWVDADVRVTDKAGSLLSKKLCHTDHVYGTPYPPAQGFAPNTNNRFNMRYDGPPRVQAGTAWNGLGGIQTGDVYPAGIRTGSVQGSTVNGLPLVIWEETGSPSTPVLEGSLVITPLIYEWDGDVDILSRYGKDFARIVDTAGDLVSKIPLPKVAAVGPYLKVAAAVVKWLDAITGKAKSRPIGLRAKNGGVGGEFVPVSLVINLAELRSAALRVDPDSGYQGWYPVKYQDDSSVTLEDGGASIGEAEYWIWMHVEYFESEFALFS